MAARAVTAIGYCPEIDGLRALAVTCVLIGHFYSWTFVLAGAGVRLFFCISGYLITHILLSALQKGGTTGEILRTFWVRRVLRICPPYYLALLLALAVNAADVRASALWHLMFATNIWMAFRGDWDPIIVGHLWSLSVEEQFYLIWPIMLLGACHLWQHQALPGLLAAGLIGVAAAWHMGLTEAQHLQEPGPGVLLPQHLDALGSGALLAWAEASGRLHRWWIIPLLGVIVAAIAGTIGIAAVLPIQAATGPLSCLCYTGLILFARHGPRRVAHALLGNAPLVWLGRRSYGVYLYHIYILYLLASTIDTRLYDPGLRTLAICGAISIIAAAVSWRLLEHPLIGLKRHFPYVSQRGVPIAAAAV